MNRQLFSSNPIGGRKLSRQPSHAAPAELLKSSTSKPFLSTTSCSMKPTKRFSNSMTPDPKTKTFSDDSGCCQEVICPHRAATITPLFLPGQAAVPRSAVTTSSASNALGKNPFKTHQFSGQRVQEPRTRNPRSTDALTKTLVHQRSFPSAMFSQPSIHSNQPAVALSAPTAGTVSTPSGLQENYKPFSATISDPVSAPNNILDNIKLLSLSDHSAPLENALSTKICTTSNNSGNFEFLQPPSYSNHQDAIIGAAIAALEAARMKPIDNEFLQPHNHSAELATPIDAASPAKAPNDSSENRTVPQPHVLSAQSAVILLDLIKTQVSETYDSLESYNLLLPHLSILAQKSALTYESTNCIAKCWFLRLMRISIQQCVPLSGAHSSPAPVSSNSLDSRFQLPHTHSMWPSQPIESTAETFSTATLENQAIFPSSFDPTQTIVPSYAEEVPESINPIGNCGLQHLYVHSTQNFMLEEPPACKSTPENDLNESLFAHPSVQSTDTHVRTAVPVQKSARIDHLENDRFSQPSGNSADTTLQAEALVETSELNYPLEKGLFLRPSFPHFAPKPDLTFKPCNPFGDGGSDLLRCKSSEAALPHPMAISAEVFRPGSNFKGLRPSQSSYETKLQNIPLSAGFKARTYTAPSRLAAASHQKSRSRTSFKGCGPLQSPCPSTKPDMHLSAKVRAETYANVSRPVATAAQKLKPRRPRDRGPSQSVFHSTPGPCNPFANHGFSLTQQKTKLPKIGDRIKVFKVSPRVTRRGKVIRQVGKTHFLLSYSDYTLDRKTELQVEISGVFHSETVCLHSVRWTQDKGLPKRKRFVRPLINNFL